MKRRSQYLRARGGRAVVIGPAPGGGRGVIARGGAAGRAAPARRRSGRRAGPAGQRSAPKQAGRGGDLAGAARRRAVLAAAWLAVCRRCSRARRSAVCWHRAGGRRWHGMQQAGRRRNARCSRCAAGAGCCRRCSVSGPAERAKRKKAGAAARCASVVPAFSAAVVAPVQGCFCRLPEGSDSSLNGISLQW